MYRCGHRLAMADGVLTVVNLGIPLKAQVASSGSFKV